MSYIFDQLRKSKKYAEKETDYAHTDVAVNDIVEAIVMDALEFAVLWYGKTNSGALKLRCYSHDKDYFDMFYVLGEECGSHGRS